MKKPFFYALAAVSYIVIIILCGNALSPFIPEETILIPMAMLSLFVLSAAIMGFLFLSEPLNLYMENKKKEAVIFFAKIVGFFACFIVVFLVLLIIF
jgi:hypothetical protein